MGLAALCGELLHGLEVARLDIDRVLMRDVTVDRLVTGGLTDDLFDDEPSSPQVVVHFVGGGEEARL